MGYQLIETVTVGSGGISSIEFTGIDQTGIDLVCLVSGRIDAPSPTSEEFELRFNNSSANFSGIVLRADGSGANSFSGTDIRVSADGSTANTFGSTKIYISNYASSSAKSVSIDTVSENNATSAYQVLQATSWNDTSAITSVKLQVSTYSFVEFSTASLYKITAD
jgi:hypothetical protein